MISGDRSHPLRHNQRSTLTEPLILIFDRCFQKITPTYSSTHHRSRYPPNLQYSSTASPIGAAIIAG